MYVLSGRNGGRRRFPKPLRNILMSAAVLLILIVMGGAVYTWIADNRGPARAPVASTAGGDIPSFAKPVAPAANAKVGVAVETLTSPIPPGSDASITIQTLAGATCSISVVYKNITSKDAGLVTKTADEYGTVTWTWTVGKTVPNGTWPVTVTCARNGSRGVVIGDLQVQAGAPSPS